MTVFTKPQQRLKASPRARQDLRHRRASAALGVPLEPRHLRAARRRRRRQDARGRELDRAGAAKPAQAERTQRAGTLLAQRASAAGIRRPSSTAAATCTTATSGPRRGAREGGLASDPLLSFSSCAKDKQKIVQSSRRDSTSRSASSRSTASPRSSRAAGASRSPRSSSSATRSTSSASATARPTRCRSRSRRPSTRQEESLPGAQARHDDHPRDSGASAPASPPEARGPRYRRDRRRRRARGARARRHPRRARQVPRHAEPDQPRQGDRRRPARAAHAPTRSRTLRGLSINKVLGLTEQPTEGAAEGGEAAEGEQAQSEPASESETPAAAEPSA